MGVRRFMTLAYRYLALIPTLKTHKWGGRPTEITRSGKANASNTRSFSTLRIPPSALSSAQTHMERLAHKQGSFLPANPPLTRQEIPDQPSSHKNTNYHGDAFIYMDLAPAGQPATGRSQDPA
ncbi:hypothetical protein BD779DRAFT_1483030 [Infundibulicybe gibba]|nr:hypothetical protein BD779DRAFT_1483030 [Infundibulicybe gibba]